jgi:anti-sigma-K factor RskA
MDIKRYIESGIIESYVLGLTTAEESAEVKVMANKHNEVMQAILDFENLLQQELTKDTIQPPPHIKSNLQKILFTGTASAKEIRLPVSEETTVTPVRNINASRYIAAAAIILLVLSTALNFYFYSAFKNSTNRYEALLSERNDLQANNAAYKTKLDEINKSLAMMEDPHMLKIQLNGIKGKEENTAAVYWDMRTKEVYLLPMKMDKVPQGMQYQLWAIVDGEPVDAGMVSFDCAGLCRMKVIPHAEAFAITLEKQGGSKKPTLSDMFAMGKVS